MEDDAEISLIPTPMAPQDPLVLEEDNLGKKQIRPFNDEFMNEKENVSTGNDLVVPRETPMMPMSKRNAKGFNLRKSLAWNKAFFTEEGVLDPMEMSALAGSVTKTSGSFQPGAKGALSPLTRFNGSAERSRPVFRDLGEKMCNKGSAKPSVKDVKAGKMPSIHGEELEMDVVSVKKSPQKGILRHVLQTPFLSSQKRVANTSRTNPASKIPKFIHTKTSLLSTKGSKCNQSKAVVNPVQSTSLIHGISPVLDKDFGSSSTSNKDSDGFKTAVVEKASGTSKINQDPFFQRKMHKPITSNGFGKPASSVQNNDHCICGNLPAGPAVAYVKPSGLRMPSPTMGFFSQGNVSPKYNSQPQRAQPQRAAGPFISKIPPPRKFTNEKPLGESRPATTQKLKPPTVATKSTSARVVSFRSHSISAENCSKPSTAAPGIQPDMMKLRMLTPHEVNREGAFSCGSSNCPTNREPVPMEVAETRIANSSQETSFPGSARDANQLIENYDEHGISCLNFSTQVCNSSKLQESDLNQQQECDSVYSLAKNPEVQNSKDGPFSVTIEDRHTVVNPTCELEFEFTTNRHDHDASMDAESSLRLNVERMTESNDSSSNLNLDLSCSQGTGIPVQSVVRETAYHTEVPAQRDNAVIPHLQDRRKHSDGVTSDILPLKKPINVVPFSDEWLAAVESYGEGILELKTGPVQNSPPDKVPSEPGPWSPVKRKAQDIGPYDCTKYSKDLSTPETN